MLDLTKIVILPERCDRVLLSDSDVLALFEEIEALRKLLTEIQASCGISDAEKALVAVVDKIRESGLVESSPKRFFEPFLEALKTTPLKNTDNI